MIDTPEIVQTQSRMTAVIRLTVPRADIQKVMGPGLSEVMAAVKAQGISATGPWFTHHLRMDPKLFDFEICLPVASPVAAQGRVTPGTLAAGKVVRTIYRGGYEGLGAAWGEFGAWIKAQGLKTADELLECYLAGPETGADETAWRTELSRPLRG